MTLNNSVNISPSTPLSSSSGGLGVSNPTANGVLVANGSSPVTSQLLTNGQLIVGSTGLAPVAATLTAGSGISVTNGAGSITIAATASPAGMTVEVTGTSQTAVVNENYIANNAGLVTVTLPAAPANLGDYVKVWGKGTGGWKVDAGSVTQVVRLGAAVSTAGGSIASTLQYDCVELRVITAGASAVWEAVSSVGNLDLT